MEISNNMPKTFISNFDFIHGSRGHLSGQNIVRVKVGKYSP